MKKDLAQIIENAKNTANKIIGSSAALRDSVAAGRSNSSEESTSDGTLTAMSVIVNHYVPTWYKKEKKSH
jgi:hypothetical protein